jgi:hypothetical protein
MGGKFFEQFPKLREVAQDGAVFVIKIDGGRILSGEPSIYTVVISGGSLAVENFHRRDGSDLEELIKAALDHYQSGAQ